jgi:hypothetical protein
MEELLGSPGAAARPTDAASRGTRQMRVCMKIQIPVEAGNKAISNGKMQPMLEEFMGSLNPEAAYFFSQGGERAMMVYFDMKESSQMPAICEPLFGELNAKIDVVPVMNLDDLTTGLQRMQSNR